MSTLSNIKNISIMSLIIQKIKIFFQAVAGYGARCLKANWLVFVLLGLTVLQSHLFIWRLQITPLSHYFIRRTIITAAFGLIFFGPAMLMAKKIKYWYLGLMAVMVALIFFVQFIY